MSTPTGGRFRLRSACRPPGLPVGGGFLDCRIPHPQILPGAPGSASPHVRRRPRMTSNECIELLLLRSCGDLTDKSLDQFDEDDIQQVYLDLILGWYLTEVTSSPAVETSRNLLDSSVQRTQSGTLRLALLEQKLKYHANLFFDRGILVPDNCSDDEQAAPKR